ncbi:LpxL/LpxP family Kdo(2)-lipid IV(A) lauroyl/palmitoleoyl acyltransferase [Vibrio mediterranei]|uniref:LpxL/LpxP family Kdo(2)-lipid IV(A) lauroyl/palmitoleoyl acyltransferase n=1 Tax=Vibrio mediterranei TaxID=689 RepID=UPI002284B71F|nr:LpxL/LpxP family Kdo(2)-lipid IV(A) lauroyl/palmitoleoyl acyltransferase [Vibrio mediterranei]MCY9855615.1 LpxL/LpxP family Kdo(2)-lipid IV(A) lauroyl/palmitoleoyl acyltransferase [Vibrio mediterranei]
MNIVPRPLFSVRMLAPKYWGIWCAFGFLAFIVNVLPYSFLRGLGTGTGLLAMKILKKRSQVAAQNLALCFPHYTAQQRDLILRNTFKRTGIALFETGMAWFWPEWRLRRISSVVDREVLLEQEAAERGTLVVCSHHLNLEMTASIFGQFAQGFGVYRPHSNLVYEFVQHRGRTRSGHQMIDRTDVRTMLRALKKGCRLWYLPDHDYGHHNSVFAPFFAVKQAAVTAGPSVLIDATNCAVISGVTVVQDNHYTLHIGEDLSEQIPRRDPETAAKVLNKELEGMIERDIPGWMWLHKRFKTRPEGESSLYS